MTWYAASVVMYFKFKDGNQDEYPIYENIYLIESDNNDFDHLKGLALEIAKPHSGDSRGTLAWGNRPSTIVVGGVRKIIEVQEALMGGGPLGHGAEVSYSQLLINSKSDFELFLKGEPVKVEVVE